MTSQSNGDMEIKRSPPLAEKAISNHCSRFLKHPLLLLKREASISTDALNAPRVDMESFSQKAGMTRKKPSSLKVRRPMVEGTESDVIQGVESCQHSPSAVKKVVSFSSISFEKGRKIVDAPDCIRCMCNGSQMVKVCPSGRTYRRTYFLDPDAQALRWHPSAKKRHKACILLDHVMEVRNGRAALQALRDNVVTGMSGVNTSGMGSFNMNSAATNSTSNAPECIDENTSLLIVHGTQFKYLHLATKTPEEAQIWFTGLSCLVYGKAQPSNAAEEKIAMRDRWLHEVFSEADAEKKGFLDEADVVRLMKSLNSGVATVRIQNNIKEAELNRTVAKGRITSEEFAGIFKEVFTRPDIYFLLVKHTTSGEYFSVDDFHLFLTAEQGMTSISRDQCASLILQFEPSSEGKLKEQLGIDGFTAFLESNHCDIFHPRCIEVCHDMTQPLPHYFIAASHRTYLLEDQLKGPCGVEGYRMALKQGCRYLEIDCWDGDTSEIIVYHGKTLTSPIPFVDVIQVIAEYAFLFTEYPLIISISNHCSLPQQRQMCTLLQQCLGKFIFTRQDWDKWLNVNTHPSKTLKEKELSLPSSSSCEFTKEGRLWPSPWDLRRKILIKGKCFGDMCIPSPPDTCGYATEEDEDAPKRTVSTRQIPTSSTSNSATDVACEESNDRMLKLLGAVSNVISLLPSKRFQEKLLLSSTGSLPPRPRHTSLKIPTTPTTRRHFQSLHHPPTPPTQEQRLRVNGAPSSPQVGSVNSHETSLSPTFTKTTPPASNSTGVYNLSETYAFRLANSRAEELMEFCKHNLVRVYPCSSRVDSSNFYPQELWNCGCQLLCLNYQNPGLMMDLQRAMFARNGNCGYCLKPVIMRQPFAYYKLDGGTFPDVEPVLLNIRIISGVKLPKPKASVSRSGIVEPYVVVEVFGLPSDCATVDEAGSSMNTAGEQRTRTVSCEQNHYALFDDCFEFEINMPDMALVRFLVLDDDSIGDEFIGQATLSLDSMQKGYRRIGLESLSGDTIPHAYLFVHISITCKPNITGQKSPNVGRGLSLKRRKQKGVYPQVKKVGVSFVDEIFKASVVFIHEAADLRIHLQDVLNEFRFHCGASSIANIRQCMHSLWHRVGNGLQLTARPSPDCNSNSSSGLKFTTYANTPQIRRRHQSQSATTTTTAQQHQHLNDNDRCDSGGSSTPLSPSASLPPLQLVIRSEDNLPTLVISSDYHLPEAFKKCCIAYSNLVKECKLLIEDTEDIADQLQQKHDEAVQRYESLSHYCIEQNFKPRKATRAMESFIWNVRLLSGQREQLRKARQDAANYIVESVEAGHTLGFTSKSVLERTLSSVQYLLSATISILHPPSPKIIEE